MADPKRSIMVRSKVDVILCKKHPKHRQAPGVCSICLRERLSRLPTSSRSTTTNATSSCGSDSSSLSSYCSSSYVSSCSSPMSVGWEAKGSSFSFFKSNKKKNNVLEKSRSMAFVTRMRGGEASKEGRKKGGFWSKLIRPRPKRTTDEVLLQHSRTTRERVSATTMVY